MECETYRNWAGCSTVDEGVDRVGLVVEVGGENVVGESGRVVGDQLGEIVSDDIGVRVAQAERISWLGPGVGRNSGAGEEGSTQGENGGGTHSDGLFGRLSV